MNTFIVITRDRDLGSCAPYTAAEIQAAERERATIQRLPRRWQLLNIWNAMRTYSRRCDSIYMNSLMSPSYGLWPLFLLRYRLVATLPILLAPRGELSAGALAIKSGKKRIAAVIQRRWTTRLDVTWHASSDREAEDISRFLPTSHPRIVVQPNPSPPPSQEPTHPGPTFSIAFVGRMVPIKNFLTVIAAAMRIPFEIKIVVAGALEDRSYWRTCTSTAASLPSNVEIQTQGHLDAFAVHDLLRSVQAMVLPTAGENFGRAIAESLSLGCPVMIPDTTLWTSTVEQGGGWIIDQSNPQPLVEALTALHSLSPEDRMAARARALQAYRGWWAKHGRPSESLFAEASSHDS